MFERFTDRARRAVVLAQDETRHFDHDYIGTEHLLLGLLREEEGVAATVLRELGLTLDETRAEVESRVGRGSTAASPRHIPFTPRAKKVLELALRQALQLNHSYIGTEHVLLGLLHEGEGVAAQVLMGRVDGGLERVTDEVMLRIGAPRAAAGLGPAMPRAAVARTVSATASEDEIRKRLEAIEARLSAIEQLLRRERGEDVS